jgi:hypothetical protein
MAITRVVAPAQLVQDPAREAADKQQAVARRARGVHGLGAAGHQVEDILHLHEAGDAPGRHLSDAISGDNQTPRQRPAQHGGGGQRLQGAQDLALTIAVQLRGGGGLHQRARIAPAQQGGCVGEQLRRLRRGGENVSLLLVVALQADPVAWPKHGVQETGQSGDCDHLAARVS